MSKTGKPAAFILKSKKEPLCVRIIKYLMLALFAYGVIFWGSVTVLSVIQGAYADFSPPAWVGVTMGAGELLVIGAMLMSVWKKYVLALVPALSGAALCCISYRWFIKTAQRELETRAVTNDLLDLDKRYIYRALPVLAGAALSLVLAVIAAVRAVRKKKQKKRDKENLPVKSIID